MLQARRWLILTHRYAGIALSPLFLVWFCSGIAMIYVRDMPHLTAQLRLSRLPELDVTSIRISPSSASQIAGLGDHPSRAVLTTILNRPAFRIGMPPVTVFADTGERLSAIGEAEAIKIASTFLNLPADDFQYAALLTEPDQWTLAYRRQLPLHKLRATDSVRTEVYVSPVLAEVVNVTTGRTRALAWVSAIPHWLYFAMLRADDGLWRQVILWSAGISTVFASIGLALAVLQRAVFYRGWLRWHYWSGAIFGAATAAWVFSGFLSMEPWFWARGSGTPAEDIDAALSAGKLDLAMFRSFDAANWSQIVEAVDAREVEFLRLQGEGYLAVRDASGTLRLVSADTLNERPAPFSTESLVSRVTAAVPGVTIVDSTLIDQYDAYYYTRDALPLPVLRVKLDDDERTWVYIDTAMSRIVTHVTRRERIQRWLYHGLHSLDFPWLYERRPLWDIVVLTLCLGGTTLSAIGVVLAVRRVTRW